MFSEESNGSISRRRQEQLKARRRELVRIKKEKDDLDRCSTEIHHRLSTCALSSVSMTCAAPTADSHSKSLESQIRSRDEMREMSLAKNLCATTIQAYFRSYKSYRNQLEQICINLKKRISDLRTVESLLVSSVDTYAPPPSIVTALVNDLIFITHLRLKRSETLSSFGSSRTYHRMVRRDFDVNLVCGILQHALLPGIKLAKEHPHLEPISPWMDTIQGRNRLVTFIRLCYISISQKQEDSNQTNQSSSSVHFQSTLEQVRIILSFFHHILGMDSSMKHVWTQDHRQLTQPASAFARVVDFCSSLLFNLTLDQSSLCADDINSIGLRPICQTRDSVTDPVVYCIPDLIRFTRSMLLYSMGSPIPSRVDTLREGSISPLVRERFSILIDFVIRAVMCQSKPSFDVRILTELCTIPLLTWKIQPNTLELLLVETKIKGYPYLIQAMDSLILQYNTVVFQNDRDRSFMEVLPTLDVPLNRCPSPSSVSLLATLAYFAQRCPYLNGSTRLSLASIDAVSTFFNFLTLVFNCIPLGTFTSRQSSVDWLCDGSQMTPIVLCPVIVDQCKILLSDNYTRALFQNALVHASVDTDQILLMKDKHDLEMEKDMAEIRLSSASSLASKDATTADRSKTLIVTSEWAKKVTRGVTSLFRSGGGTKRDPGIKIVGEGNLLDTSSVSRQCAMGTVSSSMFSHSSSIVKDSDRSYAIVPRPDLLFAICRAYSIIISRWGGYGRHQLNAKNPNISLVTDSCEPCVMNILNVLCFSTDITMTLWSLIQSHVILINGIHELAGTTKVSMPILSCTAILPSSKMNCLTSNFSDMSPVVVVLLMFASCFTHALIIADDSDLPLPQHQILRCILLFKRIVFCQCGTQAIKNHVDYEPSHLGTSTLSMMLRCLRELHDRSSRRPFCTPKLFTMEDLFDKEVQKCKSYEDYKSLLDIPIFRLAPYLVPFKRRLIIFKGLITANRIATQGDPSQNDVRPGIVVNVNRGRVLEDGLATMNKLGRNLRQRIVVRYYNNDGAEIGFDAGGLFKEFWIDLSNIAFNPNFGLFRMTDGSSDHVLYPNPSSKIIHGPDNLELFGFLGRILGKALYEGITIQPRFAHFFLSFLRGDYNYFHMLPDLSTMDSVLYNNLMFLKTYNGDARDLTLTFTLLNTELGETNEIELIPNGSQIDVTDENKNRFIGLVAKYHIYDKMKEESEAFCRGLWEVIDKAWLRIFNEPELQVLISGAYDGVIDIDDLKSNTVYVGTLSDLDPVIHRFWKVVRNMTQTQLCFLLKFVTSCERPPSLGFASLEPRFTIQRVDGDDSMLPTSSTCFNILKLPTYSSTKILREKLLLALGEGGGFHLA